ncbi:MAG: thioredoxin domain-containing protein [Sediminibacterium sp.]
MSTTHQHTNKLINETSPYLLQHAHNPVNWYPWGEEALMLAQKEQKPILVSIGYAACHWCHVMERESFEDESTAAMMNELFINIKIDREERPDLDHIYMDAVQAMTGSGGWPLNVFLTPDTKPFYGGTYFPPVRAHNRSSWKEVLSGIANAFKEKRDEIDQQATKLTEHIKASNAFGLKQGVGKEEISQEMVEDITINMLKQADTEWGGFGNAPKFPQTMAIRFLLRQFHFHQNEAARKQALLSLDKMIDGGIYDQLGGGFARYSTDTEWLAPHFEKMLYDNALIVSAMCEAYALTKLDKYARAINETLLFVETELMHSDGGFYSALDADSEGVEGKFYTWSKGEIEAILGANAELFCAYYDISEGGNWEHTNILRVKTQPADFAAMHGLTEKTWLEQLSINKGKLMQHRAARVRPLLDDKHLLGWNAMMNIAYGQAYAVLGIEKYREIAVQNIHFLEDNLKNGPDGTWLHTCKHGKAHIPAFLDDYACLIQAYIQLQEITGEGQYLLKAKEVLELVNRLFSENETGFYFYTMEGQTDIIVRKKEVYDGATPSGNALMAVNLQYLGRVFDRPDWLERMRKMLGGLQQAVVKYPTSFGLWSMVVQAEQMGWKEVALVGKGAKTYLPQVLELYSPNKILQTEETKEADFPLLAGKMPKNEGVMFYVCQNFTCSDYTTEKIIDFLANV